MPEQKFKLKQPKEDRTINLAKDGCSQYDRKTRLLVYEKKYDPPPYSGLQLPIGVTATPKSAKKIRVCTVYDMKNTCPATCVKPRSGDRLTIWGLTRKCISLGVRSAIVGSVVYWTWYIGLWGDAIQTEQLYVTMKNTVTRKNDEEELVEDHAPAIDRNLHFCREKWNSTVNKSFQFVNAGTNKISSIIEKYTKSCETTSETK